MPVQDTYFDQRVGAKHIRVLKSYDAGFAREVLDNMNEAAQKFLAKSLASHGDSDIPPLGSSEFAEYLWQEIQDGAREDWNKFSYFVVTEGVSTNEKSVFVSADWPTAEAYAKTRL
jgi:hypothetical protein